MHFLASSNRFESLKKEGVTILEHKRLAEACDDNSVTITSAELETEIEELQKTKENILLLRQVNISQLNIYKYEIITVFVNLSETN